MYHLATISLRELDDQRRPAGYASGCIVRYKDVHFVLTVSHATENQGDWAIEIDFDVNERKARLWQLGGMGFLSVFRLKNDKFKFSRNMDVSYKLLPESVPKPRFQILAESGIITHDEPKIILDSDLSLQPHADEEYGFWGLTRPSYDSYALRTVPKLETGMKYKETKNHLHFFETQASYTSYKDYIGCSGAPILDARGQLVSLVVEGDKKKTGICGFPLATIRPVLDVEILQRDS